MTSYGITYGITYDLYNVLTKTTKCFIETAALFRKLDFWWRLDLYVRHCWTGLFSLADQIGEAMVFILDGNSEIGSHVRSDFSYLICLWHLIRSRAVTNLRKNI